MPVQITGVPRTAVPIAGSARDLIGVPDLNVCLQLIKRSAQVVIGADCLTDVDRSESQGLMFLWAPCAGGPRGEGN